MVQRGDTLWQIGRRFGMDWQDIAKSNGLTPPFALEVGQKLRIPNGAMASSPPPRSYFPPARAASNISWRWPVAGPVLRTFNKGNGAKGIDIGGQRGEKILAAAPGKVIYVGNTLRGYGNLVIIKHNERLLSAYGHNDKILVREDQMVQAGEPIALMGSSDADRVMLHFEIRQEGQAVDPLSFLPSRPLGGR